MDDDTKTLAQYSLQENGFIVLMTQKVSLGAISSKTGTFRASQLIFLSDPTCRPVLRRLWPLLRKKMPNRQSQLPRPASRYPHKPQPMLRLSQFRRCRRRCSLNPSQRLRSVFLPVSTKSLLTRWWVSQTSHVICASLLCNLRKAALTRRVQSSSRCPTWKLCRH